MRKKRRLSPVIGILLLLALVISWLFSACTAEAPTPTATPTPTTTPLPAPMVKWSGDGVIAPGEYTGMQAYGDYEIHWASDEQYIYIAMKAKTSGWVAVGFKPTTGMKDADMVFGFVKNGVVTVSDQFSTGIYGPHVPDTELGGTDDILEFGGMEQDGFTTIEFRRALNTDDTYDHELTEGIIKIIWAYSSSNSLTAAHSNRGYGEITLE